MANLTSINAMYHKKQGLLLRVYNYILNIINACKLIVWGVYKYIYRFFFNSRELERIVIKFSNLDSLPTGTSSVAIFKYLKYSKSLKDILGTLVPSGLTQSHDIITEPSDFNFTMEATKKMLQILASKSLTVKSSSSSPNLRTFLLPCITGLYEFRFTRNLLFHYKSPYADNFENNSLIGSLWNSFDLSPEFGTYSLKNISWQHVGFQGIDPTTDLRGIGMLGIHSLLFFNNRYPNNSKKIVDICNTPNNKWFSFAITYFHICFLVYEWFEVKPSQVLELSYICRIFDINLYYSICAVLFVRFNNLWKEVSPENVMSFRIIMEDFKISIEKELSSGTFTLSHALLARG